MVDVRAELVRMSALHMRMPFPRGLRGEDIAGVCMVMIGADTYGCVQTWLARQDEVDERVLWRLPLCLDELNRVVPVFADPRSEYYRPYAARYYGLLREMARLLMLEVAAEMVSP